MSGIKLSVVGLSFVVAVGSVLLVCAIAEEGTNTEYWGRSWGSQPPPGAGSTEQNYVRVIDKWAPDFVGLGVTNILNRNESSVDDDGSWTSKYRFTPTNSAVRIQIHVERYGSFTDAQRSVAVYPDNIARPEPAVVWDTNRVIGVGDFCFYQESSNGCWHVMFARNNLAVRVIAREAAYPVLNYARALDADLLRISTAGR